jgi:hypothetical protein
VRPRPVFAPHDLDRAGPRQHLQRSPHARGPRGGPSHRQPVRARINGEFDTARYGSVVEDWRADRIESARQGKNPTVMARLPEAFAVMGDVHWLPGYCVLLVDRLDVDGLPTLTRRAAERSWPAWLLWARQWSPRVGSHCHRSPPFARPQYHHPQASSIRREPSRTPHQRTWKAG